ncbi:unnamed protein product [Symbiodinium microadriaticum]|nr:unnamed protein product [Symbiodinium microadriaticum]
MRHEAARFGDTAHKAQGAGEGKETKLTGILARCAVASASCQVRLLKFEDLMAIRFVVDSAVWALRNRIEQTKPPSPLPRLLHVARFVEPPLCPSQLCLRCQSRSSARLNVEG